MSKIKYDFHVHSCLSPCGDNDMTPGNIAGMAAVKGLNAIALTDHNTCCNCESFLYQTNKLGVCGICGMELTTAEEIHMVCLFETLDEAMSFSDAVFEHRMKIKNNEKIFGEQLLIDKNDEVCGKDEFFLPAATDLSLDDAYKLAANHNAVVFPAHIDKTSNGLLGILGLMPETPKFSLVEYHDVSKKSELLRFNPCLSQMPYLTNSDAHLLWDINDGINEIDVEVSEDVNKMRADIFKFLRGLGKEQA